MTDHPILPGAEPLSAPGGPHGVLVLHGFTGTPQSMRSLAQAFADAGFGVELPLLPGHGTTPEAMAATGWTDWVGAADAAYLALASRCDRVVVAGLSMGGTLATWLAADHPEIAGLVAVNPAVELADPTVVEALGALVAEGTRFVPGIASDIADPESSELAYDLVPVDSMLSLLDAADALRRRLPEVACPVLLLTSPQDHVVPPASSDVLAAEVTGSVERVTLDRSYHVATLDHDRGLIEERAVAFARSVTGQ